MGFEALAGLNGKTFLVEVDEFAEIDNEAGLGTVKTGVDGSVKFLTNTAAPVVIRRIGI